MRKVVPVGLALPAAVRNLRAPTYLNPRATGAMTQLDMRWVAAPDPVRSLAAEGSAGEDGGYMTDWTVICAKFDEAGEVSHLGVDVPRGTQHVPIAEAVTAIVEGRHRFYIEDKGDLLLLRVSGDRLTTSREDGLALLVGLPDCGDGVRYDGV
jgi:hypothetical protein